MVRVHSTYSAALAEANRRAVETGIEVAVRQMDDGSYRLQQRFEYMTDGRVVAVAKPQ